MQVKNRNLMRKINFIITALLLSATFLSCSKSPENTNPIDNGFDKTAMLTNYADNLIIPAYTLMQQKVTALQTASDAFIANPNAMTQSSLKSAYTAAHLQYNNISTFNFGPADNILLDNYLNFSGGLDYTFSTSGELTGFSTDTITINNNISSGVYDLAKPGRTEYYSQGFPALNYLYFGNGAIAKMNTKRGKYIQDLVARMKMLIDGVASSWTSYRAEFIANTKTNVGSPIGNMVNQMAYQLDILKGPRIGWPLGKQSAGKVFETKCEAYYAGISVALAVENLSALKKIYNGNASGKGLSDYLISLKQGTLNTDVLAQFDMAIGKLQAIPDPLSNSLLTEATKVDTAYKEVQKLLTLIKTDVASATAVQINFMDNDGD